MEFNHQQGRKFVRKWSNANRPSTVPSCEHKRDCDRGWSVMLQTSNARMGCHLGSTAKIRHQRDSIKVKR